MRWSLAPIPLLVLLLAALPAAAEDKTAGGGSGDGGEDESDEEQGDHDEEQGDHDEGEGDHGAHGGGVHHRFLVGAKGAGAWAKGEHTDTGLFGGGVFAEVSLVHGWLEVELGAKLLTSKAGGFHVPVDLLVKKPFHADRATVFLGIGPALNIVSHHHETHAYFGIAGVIGVYLWVKDPFGLVFEITEAVVFEEHVTNELGGTAGVVFGF